MTEHLSDVERTAGGFNDLVLGGQLDVEGHFAELNKLLNLVAGVGLEPQDVYTIRNGQTSGIERKRRSGRGERLLVSAN